MRWRRKTPNSSPQGAARIRQEKCEGKTVAGGQSERADEVAELGQKGWRDTMHPQYQAPD